MLDADIVKPDVKDNPLVSWKNPAIGSNETHRKMPRSNIDTSKPLSTEPPFELETLTRGRPSHGYLCSTSTAEAILLHLAPMNDEVR